MLETFLEGLASKIRRIRANRAVAQIAFVVSLAMIVFCFMYWPWLWKPYLQVPGASATFKLTCVPGEVAWDLVDSHARIDGAELTPVAADKQQTAIAIVDLVPTQDESRARAVLKENTWKPIEKQVMLSAPSHYLLKLTLKGVTAVNLRQMSVLTREASAASNCRNSTFSPSDLLQISTAEEHRLVRIRPIQSQISDLVLDYNERIANFLVGIMVIATTVYLGIVVVFWKRAHFTTDTKLEEQLSRRLLEVDVALRKMGRDFVIEADFMRTQRRLVFAKNIGPICGFALTVSSLIAALHPAVQVEKNSFSFLSSLQLALVATLMGLVLRVFAEFAIRFHRQICHLQLALPRKDGTEGK